MKKLAALLGIMTWHVSIYGQVTVTPRVEYQNTSDVRITKVELTSEFTKVYMRFTAEQPSAGGRGNAPFQDGYGFRRPPSGGQQSIWIDPNTRLYKPGDITKKFRFLRAEGIPVAPERKIVAPNDVVEFVTYFERLTPGIEEFDYFEGKSSNGGQTWNFEGVRINNPLNPKKKTDNIATQPPGKPEAGKLQNDRDETGFLAVKGSVLNAKTGELIPAMVTYAEGNDSVHVKSSSGKYQIGVSKGNTYLLSVTAKGFIGETYPLDLSGPSDSLSGQLEKGFIMKDFHLKPLVAGERFVLNNLYFATGEFELLPESNNELDKLVTMLRENPAMHIRVEGHTDNLGDLDKNIKLSLDRANSVAQYLIKKGIDRRRVDVKGHGPAKPVSTGNSESERQKNRRVEIVISEN